MAALRIAAALFSGAGLALLAVALHRGRKIRRRHRAVLGAPLPFLREDAARLFDAPRALYHGTRFADGARLLDAALGDDCVADLFCTEEAIFLRREAAGRAGGHLIAVPLAWVADAALARAHAELAGRELPVLKLRWRRGGELLETSLSLRGGLPQLEKLRREVHLRQGSGDALATLRRFLEPPPGAGAP